MFGCADGRGGVLSAVIAGDTKHILLFGMCFEWIRSRRAAKAGVNYGFVIEVRRPKLEGCSFSFRHDDGKVELERFQG